MNASSVILITLLTSVVTSGATVFAIERLDLIPHKQVEAPPQQATVPNVKGLSEDDARANLAAANLTLLIAGREPSSEAPPGHVLKQTVLAGAKVAKGETVGVTLAQALPKVPSVVGLSADAAATVLIQAGFKLKMGDGVVDPKVPEGKVATQAPAADTAMEKDGVVTVQVSLPPNPVDVPALLGMGHDAAKKKLQDAGLKAKIAWVTISDQQAFIVMNQDPPAGKKVRPGEEVTITVNR